MLKFYKGKGIEYFHSLGVSFRTEYSEHTLKIQSEKSLLSGRVFAKDYRCRCVAASVQNSSVVSASDQLDRGPYNRIKHHSSPYRLLFVNLAIVVVVVVVCRLLSKPWGARGLAQNSMIDATVWCILMRMGQSSIVCAGARFHSPRTHRKPISNMISEKMA